MGKIEIYFFDTSALVKDISNLIRRKGMKKFKKFLSQVMSISHGLR